MEEAVRLHRARAVIAATLTEKLTEHARGILASTVRDAIGSRGT